MEPERALADLLVASPQVEAATVFDTGGEPLGAVGVSAWWATAVVRAGRTLLADAAELRDDAGDATQVHASLEGGDVFVVGSRNGPAILAVTPADQPSGLLFHDLKRCLTAIVDEQREDRAEAGE